MKQCKGTRVADKTHDESMLSQKKGKSNHMKGLCLTKNRGEWAKGQMHLKSMSQVSQT